MENKLTAGEIIKKYIEVRGRTMKEVAAEIQMPYTTFNGILNRDAIDAYLLFNLKEVLDMDLDWMASLLARKRTISSFEPLFIPRMQEEMREHELPTVERFLQSAIKENPDSISETRNTMLKQFNMYYLLDVLLPENVCIQVIYERKVARYYCIEEGFTGKRARGYISSIPGKEMIDRIIAERKGL